MKKGWKIKKIGDVCSLMTGGTPSKSKKEYFANGTIKWLVSGDIHKKEIFDCEGRITELGMQNSNAKWLPVNSVIIALNGQGKTRGTVALLRTKATCNQSLVSIYPNDTSEILPEFLYHNLNGRYDEIRTITGDAGNERRGLNMPLIRNIEIPVPPIPEQQRIVALLDETFAALTKVHANAERNQVNAREVFEAGLRETFSNGKKWKVKTLGEITEVQSGGTPLRSRKEFWNGDIPWYSSGELNNLYTDEPERKITKLGLDNSNAKLFPKGSLLMGMYDTAALKMSILDREATFNQAVAGAKPNDNIDLKFIMYAIRFIKPEILNLRRGVRQKNLSLAKIKDIPVVLPPLAEQRAIVQRLDALAAETRRLEEVYQSKVEAVEELRRSVLGKAFEGEL